MYQRHAIWLSTTYLANNNLPVVGRPIWRLTEAKHIVKLEIILQLPHQPMQRRTNQRRKQRLLAAGEDGDKTTDSKMTDPKMADTMMSNTTWPRHPEPTRTPPPGPLKGITTRETTEPPPVEV